MGQRRQRRQRAAPLRYNGDGTYSKKLHTTERLPPLPKVYGTFTVPNTTAAALSIEELPDTKIRSDMVNTRKIRTRDRNAPGAQPPARRRGRPKVRSQPAGSNGDLSDASDDSDMDRNQESSIKITSGKPATFPTLNHVSVPGETSEEDDGAQYVIKRLMEDRFMEGRRVDRMYNNTSFPSSMSSIEKHWYTDLKLRLKTGENDDMIWFRSLWPSLRLCIIDNIRDEEFRTWTCAYYPVVAILDITGDELKAIIAESLDPFDEIPAHLLELKRQFPNQAVDPDMPPPHELVKAIKYLRQNHLPGCLLGEWQFPLPGVEAFNQIATPTPTADAAVDAVSSYVPLSSFVDYYDLNPTTGWSRVFEEGLDAPGEKEILEAQSRRLVPPSGSHTADTHTILQPRSQPRQKVTKTKELSRDTLNKDLESEPEQQPPRASAKPDHVISSRLPSTPNQGPVVGLFNATASAHASVSRLPSSQQPHPIQVPSALSAEALPSQSPQTHRLQAQLRLQSLARLGTSPVNRHQTFPLHIVRSPQAFHTHDNTMSTQSQPAQLLLGRSITATQGSSMKEGHVPEDGSSKFSPSSFDSQNFLVPKMDASASSSFNNESFVPRPRDMSTSWPNRQLFGESVYQSPVPQQEISGLRGTTALERTSSFRQDPRPQQGQQGRQQQHAYMHQSDVHSKVPEPSSSTPSPGIKSVHYNSLDPLFRQQEEQQQQREMQPDRRPPTFSRISPPLRSATSPGQLSNFMNSPVSRQQTPGSGPTIVRSEAPGQTPTWVRSQTPARQQMSFTSQQAAFYGQQLGMQSSDGCQAHSHPLINPEFEAQQRQFIIHTERQRQAQAAQTCPDVSRHNTTPQIQNWDLGLQIPGNAFASTTSSRDGRVHVSSVEDVNFLMGCSSPPKSNIQQILREDGMIELRDVKRVRTSANSSEQMLEMVSDEYGLMMRSPVKGLRQMSQHEEMIDGKTHYDKQSIE